jgi:hypothetical protein
VKRFEFKETFIFLFKGGFDRYWVVLAITARDGLTFIRFARRFERLFFFTRKVPTLLI